MLLFFLNFEKPTEVLENTFYFTVDLSWRIREMDNSSGQNCQEFNKGILQNHMIEH